MLIDRFLPRFDVVERHRAPVEAPPERVWVALQDLDLGGSRTVRWLLAARGIRGRTFRLADAGRFGFVVLGTEPGEEVVLGVIGRFWTPGGGIIPIEPAEFTTFERPGFAKGALNFRVHELPGGGTEVLTETRVLATDAVARRRFRRYWRVVAPFSGLIRRRTLGLLKAASEGRRPP